MSMRIFTRAEFCEELRKRGFQETAEKTKWHTIWLDPKGEAISVPAHPQIPDYILDRFLEVADRLYSQEVLQHKKYLVDEKSDNVIEIKNPPKN